MSDEAIKLGLTLIILDLITSVPEVGKITATSFLTKLPELGNQAEPEIIALVGVCPFSRVSSKHKGRRPILGGRASVRTLLYMVARVASRHNIVIKALYQKLFVAGKVNKVALVAAMGKSLVILNAMVKNNMPWREMEIA